MNILLVAMNYAPEQTGIAPFNTGLAEYLAAEGHRVTALTTFPHYPEWRVAPEYRGRWLVREQRHGVHVIRCRGYVPSRRSTLCRVAYDSALAVPAMLIGLRLPKPDVVLAVSPPLQLAVAAWLLAWRHRARFILQVKDLVPDVAIALGMLRNRLAIRAGRALEGFVYRRAEYILTISQGFVENLRAKGVPEEKLLVLPDWTDCDAIRPLSGSNFFRRELAIPEDAFVVLHSGNMGAKQRLENLLDAAERLPDRGFVFLLVGDGTERPRLERRAREQRLANVHFLPLQPADRLPEMLAAADVLLLNQDPAIVDTVIPSKLLTYLAAGRPVVAAIHEASEAARLIHAAGCGAVVPPADPDALAGALLQLARAPDIRRQFAAAGRRHAMEHFERRRVLARYSEFFASLPRRKFSVARRQPAVAHARALRR
jgi:colanic acid biosynthesis glycosyl transferase WcaI